jgi:cysteinyl-tRNA synthetase
MLIYNSLTKTKEEFKPRSGNRVTIYACGPTPYDYSHIGHARVYTFWDVIQRYLRFRGYDVTFVRNITDIEDKIINRAKALNDRPDKVARRYLFEFWRDMDALNVQLPDVEPRATEYLKEMIDFIRGLIEKGHAYASQGDVYFDVRSLPSYGRLTKQSLDEMIVGAREQVHSQSELEERKKSPADFALWKGAKETEPGWPSPWGYGRPGWHLECSTMIKNILGETIDLHGGGEDLLFPHHENEVAQSEGLHGKPLARFFVHNSFVQINSEKMAKSLGNFKTIRDLLQEYSADDIRLFLLQTHYRNPIDFSIDGLNAARVAIQRLVRIVSDAYPEEERKTGPNGGKPNLSDRPSRKIDVVDPGDTELHDAMAKGVGDALNTAAARAMTVPAITKLHGDIVEAMDNDFNTAVALSAIFAFAETLSKASDANQKRILAEALLHYAGLLGLTLSDQRRVIDTKSAARLVNLVLDLRARSKEKKDYTTADMIRSELTKCGINVMDTPAGSTWETG